MTPLIPQPTRLSTRRAEGVILLLAAITNVATTYFLPQAAYVPPNLAMACLSIVVARTAGLQLHDLGLGMDAPTLCRGLATGGCLAGVIFGIVALSLLVPSLRAFWATQPQSEMGRIAVAYTIIVRIPLGTALAEEALFRGAILGLLLQRCSTARAVGYSSLWFGLWHVLPTLANVETSSPRLVAATPLALIQTLAIPLVATTVGGALFSLLRLRTGSVLAPVLVHAALNIAGLWAVQIAGG